MNRRLPPDTEADGSSGGEFSSTTLNFGAQTYRYFINRNHSYTISAFDSPGSPATQLRIFTIAAVSQLSRRIVFRTTIQFHARNSFCSQGRGGCGRNRTGETSGVYNPLGFRNFFKAARCRVGCTSR
jgi:hypothetical protein